MKPNKRSQFRRIILVNWLDLPYAQVDLDSNVTIFEGGNGAGKTSIMLAALLSLMPDKRQLRSRKVSLEKNAEEAIFHRLDPEEPVAYAGLEIQLSTELVLAAVQITRQKESNSIHLDPFTIRNWPDKEHLQDFFRFTDADEEWTCDFNGLKQRAGEWGLHLQPHTALSSYFKELYDIGALPLAMATDAERSQYAHLLETSMAGGLSAALAVKLKDYLLPEYEKLPAAAKLMHDNLRACVATQTELTMANGHYSTIGGLLADLTGYITAVGTRIEGDKNSANTKLEITEENLRVVEAALEGLTAEEKQFTERKRQLELDKEAAVADVQSQVEQKKQLKRELEAETARISKVLQEVMPVAQAIEQAQKELEQATAKWADIFPQSLGNISAREFEARLRAEAERLDQEISQLKKLLRTDEEERDELKNYHGLGRELTEIAERIHATPVLQKYAGIEALEDAKFVEAKLGPLVQGLIVKNTDQAAKQIAKLNPTVKDVWLTAEADPASAISSKPCGEFQQVDCQTFSRLTRVPDRPRLGEAARKKRIHDLEIRIEASKKSALELTHVKTQFEPVIKHIHRVADDYQERSLPWLKSEAASVQEDLRQLNLKSEETSNQISSLDEELETAVTRMEEALRRFEEPEKTVLAELNRVSNAVALKKELKTRLEAERIDGIATYSAFKQVWDKIGHLPELARKMRSERFDIGGAFERLRASLRRVTNQENTSALIPDSVGEDLPAAALELPKIRNAVLTLIRTIQPHNLTDSDDPQMVIEALTQKIAALTKRFEDQQKVFRTNVDTIANSIQAEIHNRTQRILRWSNDLRDVQFGTVKGIRLGLEKVKAQLAILDDLRLQKELFSESKDDPKTAFQKFWKERTGQELTAENALDYRRFVILTIEVGDGQGKWRPVGGSTGEMVGAALSVLIILLRAWEEEATIRQRVDPLRLLFLDEAARLDEASHATLEALSASLAIQFVVAAPVVAASGRFTHYVLTRKQVGNRRRVLIRGRRRFCEPVDDSPLAR